MIGIFDSGIGGLTVVKEVFQQLPDYQLVYFGDTARTPYGNKSSELISEYAIQDVRFLIEKGAKLIVAACNTASAVAMYAVRKEFPDIPIFEVITPAVEKATAISMTKRIGVIGTTATINSNIYQKLIKEKGADFTIIEKACPLFVPLVEENWQKSTEAKMIVRKYIAPLKLKSIDTLILGCTHYPLLKAMIQQKAGKNISIVDPAHETILSVQSYLKEHADIADTLPKNADHTFYFSDVTPKVREISTKWLGRNISLKKIHLG
ncbi:glutamate racemase [Patescibacteria group bacterium]